MSLPVTAEPLPSSYTWGKVTGRIIHLIADTAEDTDDKPQARAAAGTVTFTPKEVLRKTTDANYPAIVLSAPESAALSSSGRILDAEGRQGIWLATGIYTVTFEITGAPRAIPSFDIQVTAEHTDAAPLDLATLVPYIPPTGTVVQTIVVPSGGTEGQVLVRNTAGGLVWADQSGSTGDAVASVNGQTGAVVLTAADIGAQPAGAYATLTDGTVPDNQIPASIARDTEVTAAADAAKARSTHTGTQPASTVTGLATVATTGAYTDLSGKPTIPAAPPSDAAAGTASLRTLGTGAMQATAGNDARLSNARTPTAHTHPVGDLTATGTRDGTTFLRGDGTWSQPPAGGTGGVTDHSALTGRTAADSHPIAAITGLQGALDGKQVAGAYATPADVTTASTADRDRATHTGTQTSATVSDLTEAVQDIVGAFLRAGTGTTVSYDDAAGTFTINATGGTGGTTDPEIVRDVIGTALVAGAGVQLTVNDAGDTITVASTAVLPTRQIVAGTGLTGGGDLSADRTLAVTYGTTGTTAAAGNDARLSDARTPTAHTHPAAQISDSTATGRSVVTAADAVAARIAIGAGTSSVALGTTAGTAAEGNDARITGAASAARTISTTAPLSGGGDLTANRTLAVATATATAVGVVELATTAEATTGTDTARAVTPAGLKAVADSKAAATIAANLQTGTDYTLVSADTGKAVEMSNAAANTVTVPASVFTAGQIVELLQVGTGQTTVAAGAGLTLRAPDGAKLAKQYASASLRFRSATEAVLAGNTIA